MKYSGVVLMVCAKLRTRVRFLVQEQLKMLTLQGLALVNRFIQVLMQPILTSKHQGPASLLLFVFSQNRPFDQANLRR